MFIDATVRRATFVCVGMSHKFLWANFHHEKYECYTPVNYMILILVYLVQVESVILLAS